MFKHVLLPVDGSPVSARAIKSGVAWARDLGATVTGYYAMPTLEHLYYGDSYIVDRGRVASFEKLTMNDGQKFLAKIQQAAQAAGVEYTPLLSRPATPYDGIIDAAKKQKCDVIFMASHGRGGFSSLVLGSVTQKVLAHSKIPVLVFR